MILNASTLIRNRQKDKFFGIDYYANICHGSNKMYNYLSTPLDFFPLANHKMPSKSSVREKEFIKNIGEFSEQKIFGFFANPDVYDCHESIQSMIERLKDHGHGLFIETHSLNLINDMDALNDFNRSCPLMIGIPVASIKTVDLSIIDQLELDKKIDKLVKALHKAEIPFGFILKPVIPYINDDTDDFEDLLKSLIDLSPSFIYPTFSINFDSKKLNQFYDLIDREKSALKSLYFDEYGYKKSWMSPYAEELKKTFIFNIKKTKIAYSMKQIIQLYKDKQQLSEQISLF